MELQPVDSRPCGDTSQVSGCWSSRYETVSLQLEPKESRDSSGWAKRLRLDDLPRDEKMATKKLKRYYGKLGFVEMKSTPFMFRSTAWELPSVEQLRAGELLTTYDSEIGRLLADYASNPIKLCSVSVTSLVLLSMFIATRIVTRYESCAGTALTR